MKLVGTIHCDLEGTRRLELLLSKLKPQRITIEWPADKSVEEIETAIINSRQLKIEVARNLTDVPNIVKGLLVDLFANIGYDVLVPIQYAKANGLEIFPVDHPMPTLDVSPNDGSSFISALKAGLGNLPPEIERVSYQSFREVFVREFDRAYFDPTVFHRLDEYLAERNGVSDRSELANLKISEFEEKREDFMTRRILDLKPDLHIGGIAHIFEGYFDRDTFRPLYKRLEDAVSTKIRLCEKLVEPKNRVIFL